MTEIKKEKYDDYHGKDGVAIVTVCYILTEGGLSVFAGGGGLA